MGLYSSVQVISYLPQVIRHEKWRRHDRPQRHLGPLLVVTKAEVTDHQLE